MSASDGIVGDVAPTVVHVDPSCEISPVTVSPLRESRSQRGNDAVAPARYFVSAPVELRVMNSMLPSGRTSRITRAADGSIDSRSINPAFANGFVLSRLFT